MNPGEITLAAQSLTKTLGGKPVLTDINLQLHAGEWLGILGESGSGKSTLLRILGRFLDAEQGDVFFRNEKLRAVSGELMPGHKAIRLIHQEFELFPNQTVEENIAYALRFHDPVYKKKSVEELIAITALESVRTQKAKLLSGGEKQRTAIARALAGQPDVLLLDEPFAHLDNHNRNVLATAIENLRREHRTSCIFVTHEASDALAWSDSIAVLQNGKIIQTGSPQEVYNAPVSSYVAELTGDINWLVSESDTKQHYLRPEKIRLTRNPDKCKWKGKVTAIRFHGNYWEIVCTGNHQQLAFYRTRPELEVGQEVMLNYAAKDLRSV
ncbi:ABC transporter ATP-binding protein [Dyadobacter sandarakinus]|uniref:ABC transporter ATP-binding protein n=1 Tax=Dyadobacter sandarakinus TaxID=2747268 RepID=A0ABX7IDD6_9BACT|nr:ABC transporter ATP-binding protein [Dyadobacter sandarakinus]QRR03818.1 ABC transporter ATP-binding protein [Dyadobacter sandarakinus]